ncbi:MAG: hypothetical protein WBQ09_14785 [Terriglobales bacterium]|jgi:hypothetical protein
MNIEFVYLYRDGSNYKKHGRVVFSNTDQLTPELVGEALEKAFLTDGLFIARQIRLPEVFLYSGGEFSCDDHCYHEFGSLRSTLDVANDEQGRSIGEFLVEVMTEAKRGWQVFDPYDSQGSFGSFLALRLSVPL